MEKQNLIELTADIVSAHVSNNSVAVSDVSQLVEQVHGALSGLAAAEEEPETREPAVSVRTSIKPDYLICLVCGAKQKALKRHLRSAHDMTPGDYRDAFGLKPDYPMVAPNYSEQRRALAKKIGLGRKPGGKGKTTRGRRSAKKAGTTQ